MKQNKDLNVIKTLLIILVLGVAGLAFYAYQQSQSEPDIKIEISEDGISID